MAARIEVLDGAEALVITEGTNIEITPLEVLGSYCELLNEPDPVKALELARASRAVPAGDGGRTVWTGLYEALVPGLRALTEAGVPAEFMPDLMEPGLGAPVPGPEARAALDAAQAAARSAIGTARAGTESAPVADPGLGALLAGRAGQLKAARAEFLARITPERTPAKVTPPAPLFPKVPEIQPTMPSADTINAGLTSTKGF